MDMLNILAMMNNKFISKHLINRDYSIVEPKNSKKLHNDFQYYIRDTIVNENLLINVFSFTNRNTDRILSIFESFVLDDGIYHYENTNHDFMMFYIQKKQPKYHIIGKAAIIFKSNSSDPILLKVNGTIEFFRYILKQLFFIYELSDFNNSDIYFYRCDLADNHVLNIAFE